MDEKRKSCVWLHKVMNRQKRHHQRRSWHRKKFQDRDWKPLMKKDYCDTWHKRLAIKDKIQTTENRRPKARRWWKAKVMDGVEVSWRAKKAQTWNLLKITASVLIIIDVKEICYSRTVFIVSRLGKLIKIDQIVGKNVINWTNLHHAVVQPRFAFWK